MKERKKSSVSLLILLAMLLTGATLSPAAMAGGVDHSALGHGVHDGQSGEATDHQAHGAAHAAPHFSDINWIYGFLGEKEDAEPSLLWRAPGTPIPLGALIVNTAILFFLLGRIGGPGIKKGLVERKKRVAGDIEQAARMRKEAEEQLAHYEDKLSKMESEMARIKSEMKEQAEADRKRILAEAKERRAAIEAESRQLIEQELAQARYDATVEAVTGAVEAARIEIRGKLGAADHERLSTDFLSHVVANFEKSKEVRS